jgi:hypothetical protein
MNTNGWMDLSSCWFVQMKCLPQAVLKQVSEQAAGRQKVIDFGQ